MRKDRLTAFSDGVIAIIITIMVLELPVPHRPDIHELIVLWPKFASYALSFVYIGIYWNNHHHMWHAASHVSGPVMWANMYWMFWLSLIPFATGWMGENHYAAVPVAFYAFTLLMTAIGYLILERLVIRQHGTDSALSRAVGREMRGLISMGCYAVATIIAFWSPTVSIGLVTAVALMWIVPDQRIERVLRETGLGAADHDG